MNKYDQKEAATLAGMDHGVRGYNEAMGWDTTSPEPCGHHCTSDCPRCGEPWPRMDEDE